MAPNEMTPDEMPWKDAIIKVLQDADRPLHYREITQLIGDRGLKSLSGATPDMTVNSRLHSMLEPNHSLFDDRIRKTGKGTFEFLNPDSVQPEEEPTIDDEEQDHDPNHIVRVPAYGLYWEKEKVRWGSGDILGRLAKGATVFNFAEQKGVYLLHNRSSVAYVGRTTDSLYARLHAHNRNRDHKSMRWDSFSWFGFRDVKDNGELNPMPDQVDSAHLISILEAVLIEALEPPINDRRGDFLGIQYKQVPDHEIAKEQSRSFLQDLTG